MPINLDFMTAGTLDIIAGAFILFSMVIAYFRGIIKELFTLAALYLSAMAAYFFGGVFISLFKNLLENSNESALMPKVFSYIAVYLIVFIIISLIGYFVNKASKEAGLGNISRIAGAGFGALRSALIIFVIYVPMVVIIGYRSFPNWAKDSVTVKIANSSFEKLNDYFDIEGKIKNKTAKVKEKIEKEIKKNIKNNKDEYLKRVAAGEDPQKVTKELLDKVLEESGALATFQQKK